MKVQIAFGTIAMMFLMNLPANAGGKGEIQKYVKSSISHFQRCPMHWARFKACL
jgi:hypothetical protein